MNKTNSYYGFTANCTPLQKPKAEKQLNDKFKYNNEAYRFADLAVDLIFKQGYKPESESITHGMVNRHHGVKEWGELAKPKTRYLLADKRLNLCYELGKTQYDYCIYIQNTFSSFEEALKRAEEERLAEEKARAEAEAEALKQQQEEAEQKRREQEHEVWLKNERVNYMGTPVKKMCSEVFEYFYGNVPQSCCDVVILAKDIKNPLSRTELISILHSGNKASIKIFECYTGLNLPKNQTERVEFMSKVTPAQYGKTRTFIPRKTGSKNKEKYYKAMRDGGYEEAFGEKIEVGGCTFFAEKMGRYGCYNVTEAKTGMAVSLPSRPTSLAKCKEELAHLVEVKDFPKMIENMIKNTGCKSPLCQDN